MERTLKDLCFTISSLSTDFSVLGRSKNLPKVVRGVCTRIGIELLDLDRQLYFSGFIKNDTKIIKLVDKIQAAADEANEINKELEELTLAVKKARKAIQKVTDLITKVTKESKEILDQLEDALGEVERVLDVFGIEIDFSDL